MTGLPAAALVAVAALLAIAVAAAPGDAYAQGAHHPECDSGADRDCVYHVTRALHVGDKQPWIIKEDPSTGHVYVANKPHTRSIDSDYAHLRIYDSYENGHVLIKDVRFNGTNSRISDFEINNMTREIHVVHLWGVGDASLGWDGRQHKSDGRANLTTIAIGSYDVVETIELKHSEIIPGQSAIVNASRYSIWDVAVDERRDIAYVSSLHDWQGPVPNVSEWLGPILVVDTSDTTLLGTVVNHTVGSGQDGAWDAHDVAAPASAMAVDSDTGLVYAAARVGDQYGQQNPSTPNHSWGIALLSFHDGDGELTPNYQRLGFLNMTSNPNPSPGCSNNDYNNWPCYEDVRVSDLHLDKARSQLFALYANHTVWAFQLNGTGHPEAPVEINVRDTDTTPFHSEDRIHDMVLDAERGLLYVVRYDYTDPRVVVINATDKANYAEIGSASLTSQPVGIGFDPVGGTVYVLPQWSPHAYVIEAEPRSELQKRIDNASAGDTIVVPGGTYDDTVLDVTKPLTLTSGTGMPGDVVFTGYSRVEIEADDVTVRGLTFRDTDCLPGYGAPLIEIRTQHNADRSNLVIENNTFSNTCHPAIQKEGIADIVNIAIRNNVFENIGLNLPPGETEPLDTGGANEFQIAHGAIGLAHHPGQGTVSGVIADNHISGTSAAGIRVFKADGLAITGNYIADTPSSAIGLAHAASNVLVANNTIVGANSEPDLDYLAGVNGSGIEGHYRFANLGDRTTDYLGFDPYMMGAEPASGRNVNEFARANIPWRNGTAVPSPDAAINIWSKATNITVTGNTISGSDGALTVCTGVCAYNSDGFVAPRGRTIAPIVGTGGIGGEINFTGNTIYAHTGPDNGGVQVRSHALGTIGAGGNTYVGCGMGGEPVRTAGNIDNGSRQYEDGGCAYHVTRTLGVGDIIPNMVRVDEETGNVYVANRPHLGTRDQDYSHLRIYDGDTAEMLGDIRFNGTNSRISDVEVSGGTAYVAHMWGIGDRSLGWDGRTWNGDGRMNLTAIGAAPDGGAHAVLGTVQLMHGDGAGGNVTRDVISDLAVDAYRGRAYVSTERAGPVLAIDVSDPGSMRLLLTSAGNASAGEWSPYHTAAPASALAVNNATGMVYASARVGDGDDSALHSWGIATLDFGADGAFAPNYTRAHFLNMSANPAPDPAGRCGGDYNLFPCSGDILVESLHLDEARGKMFALYANHTIWAFEIGGAAGLPSGPAEVDVRQRDPAPGSYEDGYGRTLDHNQIRDIALDRTRGLLYASLYDFANPRVAVIDAGTHERVGLASTSSQTASLGVDARTGAVYALPQWTPNAYVIEAAPMPVLQAMIDGARPGSTIALLPGTHDDAILDVAKPLTLASASGVPGSVTFTGYSRIEVEADNTAIRGLTFRDTDCMPGLAASLVEIRTYGNDYTRSNVTVEDNTFSDTCHAAVQQEGVGRLDNVQVRGNTFERIGLKLADGRTQPIDTGGENEFQLFHGAIGLAHHPSQEPVSGAIADNRIVNTSAAGIRVFNADGMAITNNHVEGTPASGIGLAHGPSNAVVSGNTLVRTNSEPNLDYLDGIEGSGEPGYYGFINFDRPNPYAYLGMQKVRDGPPHAVPSPDAAINVWAGAVNVSVTENTIRDSDGAFTVCTGVCAFESDGPVRDNPRNVPANTVAVTGQVRFTGNTIHAHVGPDNGGILVRSHALGTLDATGNTLVGANASGAAAGMVRLDADGAPVGAAAVAAFVSPNRILAVYDAPLGPPAGHTGPVYGSVMGPGGLDEEAATASGLYTTMHTIEIGGDGVGEMQSATISLNADLEGVDRGGTHYVFRNDSMPVGAISTNVAVVEAALTSPDTARIVYGAPLDAAASDYAGLRVGPSNATAAVTGVEGSGTAAHTVSFETEYAVTAATAGYIDIAPLALLPEGNLFAGADGMAVGSGEGEGMDAVAPPGSHPIVIEQDTFVASVSGTDSAAIRVPGGTTPAANFTVSTETATVTLAPRTNITDRGTGMPYEGAFSVAVAAAERRAAAAGAVGAVDDVRIGIVVEIGDPNADIALDRPARILLENQPAPADVYHMDSAGMATGIAECGDAADPGGWLAANRDASPFCHTVEGGAAAAAAAGMGNYTIYTYRLSAFFVVGEDAGTGGGSGGDGRAPMVSRVAATSANGTYGLGETIGIAVVFTEPVNVTGTPLLELETGAVDRNATYASSDSVTLMFRYVVQQGDSAADLGYTGTDALALNGGTIRDGNGSDADLALPAPGTAGSLSHSADIAIEAPNTMTQRMTANLIAAPVERMREEQVVVASPAAQPSFMPFGGGGGGGGRGGGGGGGAAMMPGAAGQAILYSAAWDCDEGTIRITAGAEPRADVSVVSSAGTVEAQEADGPHPAGRTVYEAPLPEDGILSIRAAAVDGRTMSTATEAVRTGGQCTGEVVFRAYDAAADAPAEAPRDAADRMPQADDPEAAAEQPDDGRQEPAGEAAPPEDERPGMQADGQGQADAPPPLPADTGEDLPGAPGADERPPDAEATATDEPGTTAATADGEGGCLIATAAYGTEIAPQVQHLREVRDSTLLTTESGRAFMAAFGAAYYAFSPHVADLEREHPAFRQAVAALVAPMLLALHVVDSAEPGSEHSVAAYGMLAISLVAGMYVAAPAAGAWYAVRLARGRGGRKARAA